MWSQLTAATFFPSLRSTELGLNVLMLSSDRPKAFQFSLQSADVTAANVALPDYVDPRGFERRSTLDGPGVDLAPARQYR